MKFTIEGQEYDIPESEIQEIEIAGFALVKNGFVTTEDIDVADQDAASVLHRLPIGNKYKAMHARILHSKLAEEFALLGGDEKVVVRSARVYFELPDKSISVSPPIGSAASHIEAHWLFTWAPRVVIQQLDNGSLEEIKFFEAARLCIIDGNKYAIPANIIHTAMQQFMTKVTGRQITEADVALLDSYIADTYDERLAISANKVEIQRMRLYFKLPDGTITRESPVGRSDSRLECCSILQTVSKDGLSEFELDAI